MNLHLYKELNESPHSLQIKELAKNADLFFFHYEQRRQIRLPDAWTAKQSIWQKPEWQSGVYPEWKYQNFRNDLLIASYHPGQSRRWTSHELLHKLVGFCWNSEFSNLQNVLSARLSEVLPVLSFYFFESYGRHRCNKHKEQNFISSFICPDCEDIQTQHPGPKTETDSFLSSSYSVAAQNYFQSEWNSIESSLQKNSNLENIFANLNLAQDGIEYVAAHSRRMANKDFSNFIECFFEQKESYYFHRLEDFQNRVYELFNALISNSHIELPKSDPYLRISQDLAERLLRLKNLAKSSSEKQNYIELYKTLSLAPNKDGIKNILFEYQEREKRSAVHSRMLSFNEFSGIGYRISDQYLFSHKVVEDSLHSIAPVSTHQILSMNSAKEHLQKFAQASAFSRLRVGHRWLEYLKTLNEPLLIELAGAENILNSKHNFYDEIVLDAESFAAESEHCRIGISKNLKCFSLQKQTAEALDLWVDEIEDDTAYFSFSIRKHNEDSELILLNQEMFEKLQKYSQQSIAKAEINSIFNENERENLLNLGFLVVFW